MAILEYLEERWPEPPLLPRDPWRRARARQLAEIVNSGMQPFQNSPGVLGYVKDVLHGDERAWVQHHHARGLVALETTAAETAGKFLVGDEVTFADVFLVPQLYGCRRFGVDLAPYPTLLRVEAACVALPAFAAAQPDRQPDVRPAG
jgi:maleylpyruvate isomerase